MNRSFKNEACTDAPTAWGMRHKLHPALKLEFILIKIDQYYWLISSENCMLLSLLSRLSEQFKKIKTNSSTTPHHQLLAEISEATRPERRKLTPLFLSFQFPLKGFFWESKSQLQERWLEVPTDVITSFCLSRAYVDILTVSGTDTVNLSLFLPATDKQVITSWQEVHFSKSTVNAGNAIPPANTRSSN